jgi:hypothetical protein
MPVDELGVVSVLCGMEPYSEPRGTCWRHAMEEVCQRGGDVVWGVARGFATARGGVGFGGGVGLSPHIAVAHTRIASE